MERKQVTEEEKMESDRLKQPEEKRRKWTLLLVGIVMIVIGIIGLVLRSVFAGNEMLSAAFFGFGLTLIILGSLVTVIAFWKLSHIEYGF